MKSVARLLPLVIILGLLLLIYELLLTQPNVVVTFRGSMSDPHQVSLPGMTVHSRALKQLLQDSEITQLPVTILLECSNYPNSPEKYRNEDPNVVCLNETQLYSDVYDHYGIVFEDLSLLDKKASIVRAVLDDLESRNRFSEVPSSNRTADYVNEDDEFKVDHSQIEQHQEVYFPRSQNIPVRPSVVRRTPVANPGPTKPRTFAKSSDNLKLLNKDLLKLAGQRVEQSYDLSARKFSTEWLSNSSVVHDRLKYISMAVEKTDPSKVSLTEGSLNPNLLSRAKFQHEQLSSFCADHTLPLHSLPVDPLQLDTLFQHLLYDDTRRLVFCYVPKNGCSNMKRMMLVLNGILPPEASKNRRPDESVLKQVHSFRKLSRDEAIYKLTNYFKLAIVRNPLERLLSAYMNKLEKPFIADLRKQFPERLKAFMLKSFRRAEFETWIKNNDSSVDIHPTFDDFIAFMNMFPLDMYNEHFKPFLQLCSPCAVQYDMFLSFKTLEYDVFAMMEHFNIPFSLYPESLAKHTTPVSDLMEQYYQQVSSSNKNMLNRRFLPELDFYFKVHPEEAGMNNH